MPDCYCKREYLDPSVRRMRSNDGIVHGVNGCFSSGETGVGGRSWEKRALDAEEKVQRVRSACNRIIENAQRFDLDDEHGLVYGQWMTAKSILRALDGDAEPELDISISSYAKEADDGEAMWNDGGDA